MESVESLLSGFGYRLGFRFWRTNQSATRWFGGKGLGAILCVLCVCIACGHCTFNYPFSSGFSVKSRRAMDRRPLFKILIDSVLLRVLCVRRSMHASFGMQVSVANAFSLRPRTGSAVHVSRAPSGLIRSCVVDSSFAQPLFGNVR